MRPPSNALEIVLLNMRTRHMRKGPNRPGEIVKYEASLDASNVMLVDTKTKKRSRVGFKTEKGKKVRVFKKSGEEVKKAKVETAKVTKDDAKKTATKKSTTTKKDAKTDAPEAGDKKSPFWKKMGFGADELAGSDADVDVKNDDHSVPDQVERSSTRGSSRGS